MKRRHCEPPSSTVPVAIYARVSTVEQSEQGFCLDAQLAVLRDYAARQGYMVAEEFVDSESASHGSRTAFGRMLESLKEGRTAGIVVEKADRLSRNFADIVRVDEVVEQHGIKIHFVKDGVVIDKNSRSSDKLTYGIKVVLAKHFSDNLREEVKKGMNEKAKQGIFPSFAPIGYLNAVKNGKRTIDLDPERAPLVKRVFEAYARREVSISTAAAFARQIGLTSRKGKWFARASIGRMLENRTYAGFIEWGGSVFPGTHEPIVSLELFDAVQDVMHGRVTRAGFGAVEGFAYRGILSCGYCGCAMTAELKKQRYRYYRCTGMRDSKCPGKKVLSEEKITEQFAALLADLTLTPETFGWLKDSLKESLAEERELTENRLFDLEVAGRRLRQQLEQLYLDKLSGEVPASIYGSLKERLERELAENEISAQALKRTEPKVFDAGLRILELAQTASIRFKHANLETKGMMLRELQSNCVVRDGIVQVSLLEPFDILLSTNREVREKGLENGPNEIWYSERDSNPRSSP